MSAISIPGLDLGAKTTHTNLSTAELVEIVLQRNEGKLAARPQQHARLQALQHRQPKDLARGDDDGQLAQHQRR